MPWVTKKVCGIHLESEVSRYAKEHKGDKDESGIDWHVFLKNAPVEDCEMCLARKDQLKRISRARYFLRIREGC